MKILTVSIAAYNVEEYLVDTLESLCDPRYLTDIEILVIDDGSKDKTAEIAGEYQKKYPDSVRAVSKENGGHGSTINKGIELATGKYFRVIDGDDYVDPDEFYNYIQKLKNCDTDLVITDYWWVDDDGKKYQHNHTSFKCMPTCKIMTFSNALDTSLFGLSTLSVKTKLLRKNDCLHITENCYYVDVEYVIWLIALSNKFVYYNDKVYMYRCIATGQNSVNKANMLKNVKMQETVALNLCALYEYFKKNAMLEEGKRAIILDRIAKSMGAVYRTYLLLDRYRDSRLSIINLDKRVFAVSSEIYQYVDQKRFIRYIRRNEYMWIMPIRLAYRVYLRWKRKR